MKQIAIIGAGVAGLAAAGRLREAGFACTIYEKSRGVGGRAATRRVDQFTFDHGANYVKAPDGPLRALIEGSRGPQDDPAQDIGRPVWVFDAENRITEGDPEQNADEKWTWRSGITALARSMAAGMPIEFGRQVTRIAPGTQARYGLFDAADALLGEADIVLLTPPGPQTAAILERSSIDADLRDAMLALLEPVQYRRCISYVFAFPYRPQVPWYSLVNIDRRHPIAWLACEHDKPGRVPDGSGLIMAQMSHDFSVAHWDEVAKGTAGPAVDTPFPPSAETVAGLIGELIGQELGAPGWVSLQRWRYALPDGGADFEQLNRNEVGLYFAGDYVTGLGRVHLAIESGWQVAELMSDE